MILQPLVHPALIVTGVLLLVAGCLWLIAAGPRRIRWSLRLGCALLLGLALMRPGVPAPGGDEFARDLNVFFVVDTTASMGATDWEDGSDRLSGARADIAALAEELAGARFSLITFDAEALTRMPLTTDAAALTSAVELLEPEYAVYSQGSSPWAAAEHLRERLEAAGSAHPDTARLVFYFGDGEQTVPMRASYAASADLLEGGAVFGYGTESGATMPRNEPWPSEQEELILDPGTSQPAVSVPDPQTLTAIGEQLGVAMHMREPGEAVTADFDAGDAATARVPGAAEHVIELTWIPVTGMFGLIVGDAVLLAAALASLRRAGSVGRAGGPP